MYISHTTAFKFGMELIIYLYKRKTKRRRFLLHFPALFLAHFLAHCDGLIVGLLLGPVLPQVLYVVILWYHVRLKIACWSSIWSLLLFSPNHLRFTAEIIHGTILHVRCSSKYNWNLPYHAFNLCKGFKHSQKTPYLLTQRTCYCQEIIISATRFV